MVTFLANTIKSQLIIYGTAISIAVFLRPNISAKRPHGTAPTIAPMAKNEAIHVFWSFVTCIRESFASNCSATGDVHDKPVPAAAAPKHTVFTIPKWLQQKQKQNKLDIWLWNVC